MLMIPETQDVLYKIGLASLGATQHELEQLAAAYWYTFEVGLCQDTDGSRKLLGGALLTSIEESNLAMSPKAKIIDFDIETVTKGDLSQSIQYSGLQKIYVMSPEIHELCDQLDKWVDHNFLQKREYSCTFCEKTRSIIVNHK